MQKPQVVRDKAPISSGLRSASMNPTNEPTKISREDLQKQLERRRARDEELVSGIFKNNEDPAKSGGRGKLVFSYKFYKNQPYEVYELFDGEKYTLPRGVARHLNNNCYYKQYQQLPGAEAGVATAINPDGRLNTTLSMQASKKIHRYAFHSLEYMDDDIDMYPTNLIEVTASI
jgi:hypothetical protein